MSVLQSEGYAIKWLHLSFSHTCRFMGLMHLFTQADFKCTPRSTTEWSSTTGNHLTSSSLHGNVSEEILQKSLDVRNIWCIHDNGNEKVAWKYVGSHCSSVWNGHIYVCTHREKQAYIWMCIPNLLVNFLYLNFWPTENMSKSIKVCKKNLLFCLLFLEMK